MEVNRHIKGITAKQYQRKTRNRCQNIGYLCVIKYRSIKLSDIKNKEQKRFYAKMKKLHRLPDNRSEEQKERDLLSAFELLFQGARLIEKITCPYCGYRMPIYKNKNTYKRKSASFYMYHIHSGSFCQDTQGKRN